MSLNPDRLEKQSLVERLAQAGDARRFPEALLRGWIIVGRDKDHKNLGARLGKLLA